MCESGYLGIWPSKGLSAGNNYFFVFSSIPNISDNNRTDRGFNRRLLDCFFHPLTWATTMPGFHNGNYVGICLLQAGGSEVPVSY